MPLSKGTPWDLLLQLCRKLSAVKLHVHECLQDQGGCEQQLALNQPLLSTSSQENTYSAPSMVLPSGLCLLLGLS